MKIILALISAAAMVAVPAVSSAAPCRDAKGKFVKCPPPKPVPAKKVPCRDAKGKFAKCKK